MSKKIVVLGAGYSGVLIAKKLTKKLKGKDVDITIIDKNPFHTMLTELHEVAAWRVEEDSIRIDLKKVFAGRKVNVVLDTIESTDYKKQVLQGKTGTYQYDYLVLATGSKPTYFGIEGAEEHSFPLWSYDDAVRLREHIMEMFRRASTEPNIEEKKRLLTFYVIGSGFTGVEMIGELAELVPILCQKFQIDPSLVTMCNVDFADRVMPILPEKLSAKAENRLKKMNVNVILKASVVGLTEDTISYNVDGSKKTAKTNTVIWAAGTQGSDIAIASEDLGIVERSRGRIQTDKYLRSVKHPNVYIGGDNMFYIPEGETRPVPQMVENCEACAKTISSNIVSEIAGNQSSMSEYKPKFHGMMVCIGGRYGVAYVGGHNSKFALPSFFAMLSKHFINMVYFFHVLGWNKVFSYTMNEFFTIRNRRSFVGGHFSNRSPSFLLVPLRIYLGVYWAFEGYKKIMTNWHLSPRLSGMFSGADAWWNSMVGGDGTVSAATSAATDAASSSATSAATDVATSATSAATDVATSATSAATDAVTSAVTSAATSIDAISDATSAATGAAFDPVIMNIDFFGLFHFLFVSGGELAIRLTTLPTTWFMDTFVTSSDANQIFFQHIVAFSELFVGLLLIVGLFTTAASAYSLALLGLFITSTGLYMSSWWMIFSAIALMFGGGKTFALDYYLMPMLKSSWKKINIVKKWYVYND